MTSTTSTTTTTTDSIHVDAYLVGRSFGLAAIRGSISLTIIARENSPSRFLACLRGAHDFVQGIYKESCNAIRLGESFAVYAGERLPVVSQDQRNAAIRAIHGAARTVSSRCKDLDGHFFQSQTISWKAKTGFALVPRKVRDEKEEMPEKEEEKEISKETDALKLEVTRLTNDLDAARTLLARVANARNIKEVRDLLAAAA